MYSGYGYGSLTELTEVPGRYTNVCTRTRTRTRVFLKGHTRTPGIVPRAYISCTSSGYGYECRTETHTLDNRFQVNRQSIGSYSNRRPIVACDSYRSTIGTVMVRPWKAGNYLKNR